MYPHRRDLAGLPFWVHDKCGSMVGTHHKTSNPTRPLGILTTPELRRWRRDIHAILDPLWRNGKIGREQAYKYISNRVGRDYHTADIYSVPYAKEVYGIVRELKNKLDPGSWDN